MAEKDVSPEIDWNSASYTDFLSMQSKLRQNFRATTPMIDAANFPELMQRRGLFRSAGFEANEHSSGGISIFVETEEEYTKLQKFATENNLKIKMPRP